LADLGVEVRGTVTGRFLLPWVIRQRADVLHLHWLNQFSDAKTPIRALIKLASFITELLILRLLGVRIVFTAHNLIPHESKFPKIDLLCTAMVTRIAHATVAHGESARDILVERCRLRRADRIHVVPCGNYSTAYPNTIDSAAARRRLGIPGSDTVFLFLGAIRPYKGVPELIDAFSQITEEEVRLLIAGRPWGVELENELMAKCSQDQRIGYYPGVVENEDIQVFMNAADVVVLPYKDILTSAAAVLAMSFAEPCVAPRLGCLADVLDEKGAFLYDPSETNGLLNAMLRATEKSANELEAMGQYNFRRAQEWSWEHIAGKHFDMYRSCIDRKSPSGHAEIVEVRDLQAEVQAK
jgi:glycosyltransferase involved in cell wall biosynthesis